MHWKILASWRTQPGIKIVVPADYEQARTALIQTWNHPSPIYYRLGKDEESTIPDLNGHFELGQAQLISEGDDILFITTGSITKEVVKTRDILESKRIASSIMVIASIEPPPISSLVDVLRRFPLAITVEAHYRNGGLGSLVSQVVADYEISCRIVRCGVGSTPNGLSGSQSYYDKRYGLSHDSLVETTLHELQRKSM